MSRPVLLLVGGVGRMEALYRAAAESLGFDLLYAEKRLPRTPPQVARIVVVASVVSHPLQEAAERVAMSQGVAIDYLRTASVSALRKALGSEVRCGA